MNSLLASPQGQDQPLAWGQQNLLDDEEQDDEQNLIKIKLFFYCSEKSVRGRVFPDEWYTVVADEFGTEEATPDFQPWLEVSKHPLHLSLFLTYCFMCSSKCVTS